jgi:hypothetical protein
MDATETRHLYGHWTTWLLAALLLLTAVFFVAGCGALAPLGLAGALRQAAAGSPVAYQLDGTVGIDAGRLGQPTFGPMLLTRGELGVR